MKPKRIRLTDEEKTELLNAWNTDLFFAMRECSRRIKHNAFRAGYVLGVADGQADEHAEGMVKRCQQR